MKKPKTNFVKQKKLCYKCNQPIDELNDNFIKLITYNDGEIVEDVWFHLFHNGENCWGKYNQERVEKQLSEMSKVGFGILKNMGMNV